MKPARATAPFILLAGVFITRSAWANDPPAPPAWLAEFSIVPLALLTFSWSGAAQLYDESTGIRGRRGLALCLSVLVTLMSGIHEGFAVLIAPLLCTYAIIVALRMMKASSFAPQNSLVKRASQWGGILLIPTVIFLASFSWVFMGSYRYSSGRWASEAMPEFYEYQRSYAKQHDGKFQELRLKDMVRAENDDGELHKQWIDSRAYVFAELSSTITQIEVNYSADLKSYQVKIKPLAFVPWPYRIFSPRRAYFMNEDGIIHYENSWSSSTEATATSPRL